MKFRDLLLEAEKIYAGIRDASTVSYDLKPLWDYPVLLEAYLAMLRQPDDDAHQHSFEVLARLLCPEFLRTAHRLGAFPAESLEIASGG
jgi:hypothetical protein